MGGSVQPGISDDATCSGPQRECDTVSFRKRGPATHGVEGFNKKFQVIESGV